MRHGRYRAAAAGNDPNGRRVVGLYELVADIDFGFILLEHGTPSSGRQFDALGLRNYDDSPETARR